MMAAKEQLNGTLQESILTLLAHNDEHGRLIAGMVDPNLFEGDYRVIAERCIEYWKKYNAAPAAHLDDELSDILDDEHNRKAPTFRRIMVAMVHLNEEINVGYVIDKLTTFVRMQKLKSAILTSAEQLNKKQEMAVEEIEAIWDSLLRTRSVTFDAGSRLTEFEKILTFMEASDEFATGIKELDQRHVIPARGEVGLFLGAAGRGKSWWLVNVGKRALMQRKHVLHLTLEMSEPQVMQRYYQSLFSLTKRATSSVETTVFEFNESDRPKDDPEEKWRPRLIGIATEEMEPDFSFGSPMIRDELAIRIEHYQKRFNNLIIKRFPPRTLTASILRAYLDTLEVVEKFIPDMIILDYMGLWKTDASNHRITLGRAFEEFRGVCIERNASGETAHQVSKAGAAAIAANSTNVAEDWSMIGTADRVLTYSCTDYEFNRGLGRLFVSKSRTEQDRWGVLLTQNYEIGQFHLQSIPLRAEYYKMLEQMKKDSKAGIDEQDNAGDEEDGQA
jgi:hypothetical protein